MKVLTHPELLEHRRRAREDGRRVVQCHGCFDIVHPGHIRHLRQARALGDILLVTITADAAIAKGTGRPLIPEELRADNLAELDCVDWVYIERRSTAAELLGEVRPDIYVKGKEYESNADPRFAAERHAVESHGGRVVFSSGDVVFSSTALIAAMEQAVDPFHKQLAQLLRRPELDGPALMNTLARARGQRVLIVGEARLDTYIFCDRPALAEEAPTLSLRPVDHRHYDAAAAGLARQLAALGMCPILVTACASGEPWESMRTRLIGEGVEVRAIASRTPLGESQRFIVGTQKMVKVDLVEPVVLDATEQAQLADLAIAAAGEGVGATILADYGQGLLGPKTLPSITRGLRRKSGCMAAHIASRRSILPSLRAMDMLCIGEQELRDHAGPGSEGLTAVVWKAMEETGTKAAAVSIGSEGLMAFDRLPGADSGAWVSRLRSEHIPSLCPIPVDMLGCAEASTAAMVAGMAAGAPLVAGAYLASIAGAIEAQRLGHIPVSASDVRKEVVRLGASHLSFTHPEIADARAPRRAAIA